MKSRAFAFAISALGVALFLIILQQMSLSDANATGQGIKADSCRLEEGRTFLRHYSCPKGTYVTSVRPRREENLVLVECTELKVVCD